ncbi:hypothetical protein BN2476_220006 [Paraburkholderia piptadeniae]|uniref:LysR substrate-binding domain-containing protein n=1 Tax=Paraburkholderia piptadeniae TaxID=1701573 RepID=A0A1N7RWC6_9BURK|nr:hypothetical protein BN2476_220006 [Paraburkholderia piptadeniae]
MDEEPLRFACRYTRYLRFRVLCQAPVRPCPLPDRPWRLILRFVRRLPTRRVEPTEIGLKLYEHGRTIRNALRAAQESVSTLGESLQGRVRLSLPSGYGQPVMSEWLIAFKREFPGTMLDVMFENRVEDLLRDEVDVAVRVMSELP